MTLSHGQQGIVIFNETSWSMRIKLHREVTTEFLRYYSIPLLHEHYPSYFQGPVWSICYKKPFQAP